MFNNNIFLVLIGTLSLDVVVFVASKPPIDSIVQEFLHNYSFNEGEEVLGGQKSQEDILDLGVIRRDRITHETTNNYRREQSASQDIGLNRIIEFIEQRKNESELTAGDNSNGITPPNNIRTTTHSSNGILSNKNETTPTNSNGTTPSRQENSSNVVLKVQNDFVEGRKETHSVSIELFIESLLNQLEGRQSGKLQNQEMSSGAAFQGKESTDNLSSREREPHENSTSTKKNVREPEGPESSSQTSSSKVDESFHKLNLQTNDSTQNANYSGLELSSITEEPAINERVSFENIINKLTDIIKEYKENNSDYTQQNLNPSPITISLLEQLNMKFHADKNGIADEHLSPLMTLLRKSGTKVRRPSSKLNGTENEVFKGSRTDLTASTNELRDGTKADVVEYIYTYLLNKLNNKVSNTTTSAPKARNDLSAEAIFKSKKDKTTTIYIYPLPKVEVNSSNETVKLDSVSNSTRNGSFFPRESFPYYTILNGQVIGSIDLSSILNSESNTLGGYRFQTNLDVDVENRTFLTKGPVVKADENLSDKQHAARFEEETKPKNISREVDKITNINNFIHFLKSIQQKINNKEPTYETNPGFDLSSLRVANNENVDKINKSEVNYELNMHPEPAPLLYQAFTTETNIKDHRLGTTVDHSKEKSSEFFSVESQEDYYDFSSYESEENEDFGAMNLVNKLNNISNFSTEKSNSINSKNDDKNNQPNQIILGNFFHKRSGDFDVINQPLMRSFETQPTGKSRRKNNRKRTKQKNRKQDKFSTVNCQCGQASNQRIVGGVDSPISRNPWVAQLASKKGNPFCGGTLVNDRFILTAAHCLRGRNPEDMVVKMGSSTSNQGESFPVKRIISHEGYSSETVTKSDIGLVELREPMFKYSSFIKPICLPTSDYRSQDRKKGIIAGFGSLSEDGPQSEQLQEASVLVLESLSCEKNYKYSQDQLNPSVLCAKGENVDACQGDSGGPLIRKIGNSHVQVGVTSWGIGCARDEYPGIYTKVASYLSWIESQTMSATYCRGNVRKNRPGSVMQSSESPEARQDAKIIREFVQFVALQLKKNRRTSSGQSGQSGQDNPSPEADLALKLNSPNDQFNQETFELIHG